MDGERYESCMGKLLWLKGGAFEVDSQFYGLFHRDVILEETELFSLSVISLRSAATPCQSCFR